MLWFLNYYRFNFFCFIFTSSARPLSSLPFAPQQDLPINIKFCFEGMEESGSEGLDDLVFSRKDSFFKDVDYVCISDNYWLGKTKPCITYGLRGICYFFIEVTSYLPTVLSYPPSNQPVTTRNKYTSLRQLSLHIALM